MQLHQSRRRPDWCSDKRPIDACILTKTMGLLHQRTRKNLSPQSMHSLLNLALNKLELHLLSSPRMHRRRMLFLSDPINLQCPRHLLRCKWPMDILRNRRLATHPLRLLQVKLKCSRTRCHSRGKLSTTAHQQDQREISFKRSTLQCQEGRQMPLRLWELLLRMVRLPLTVLLLPLQIIPLHRLATVRMLPLTLRKHRWPPRIQAQLLQRHLSCIPNQRQHQLQLTRV